ncbi:Cardiolipin synthase N-terminal domain-containing protein [Zobellia nedashkovskayae]
MMEIIKPILIIAFLILSFWSVYTSFNAVYLILTKDFKGSKVKWILIAMIGIIGPILWVIKGKKLVS